jgi:ABC-type transport system involved in cytochrome c biogenesis ATPase subunit
MTSSPASLCSIRGEQRLLTIHAGEMILVTGPVGSGKTHMLRRLAGLAPLPSSVSLIWDRDADKSVRMLFEHVPPLWVATTLGEELVFGLHPVPDGAEIHQARKAWRLESLADSTPVEGLNRIQAIRLALASMELARTRLALIDNPTASLPLDDADTLREDIAAWTERSTCAVVIACNRYQDWQPWVQQAWRLAIGEDLPAMMQQHD